MDLVLCDQPSLSRRSLPSGLDPRVQADTGPLFLWLCQIFIPDEPGLASLDVATRIRCREFRRAPADREASEAPHTQYNCRIE
jgi:hypothetical protein